jgi:peroxiredoxin
MSKVEINSKAPDFELSTYQGESFRLSDLEGQKNVVLVFNRGFT